MFLDISQTFVECVKQVTFTACMIFVKRQKERSDNASYLSLTDTYFNIGKNK